MDLRRIGSTTAAGGVGSFLAWAVTAPFAPQVAFPLPFGTPFGFLSSFLLGCGVAGPIAYVIGRSRGDARYALRTALWVALGAGLFGCALEAFAGWMPMQVYRLVRGTEARKIAALATATSYALCLVPSGIAFAAMMGSPTKARLLRAIATGLIVGMASVTIMRSSARGLTHIPTVGESQVKEYVANLPWGDIYHLSRWSAGILAGLAAGLFSFGVRSLWLRREFPTGAVQTMPLEDGPNRIGKEWGLEVCLWDDISIQPRHAVLECARSPWRIRSEGTAPLFVNGHSVPGTAGIEIGDVIQVGNVTLRLTNRYSPSSDLPPVPVALKMRPALIDEHGGILPLRDGRYTVGRDVAATLAFPYDPSVSRHHAELEVRNGIATLWDVGSSNGTAVNGVPIHTRTVLSAGDQIAFGNVALTFRHSA